MKKLIVLSVVLLLCFLSHVNAGLINVAASENGGTATAISEGTYLGYTLHASNAINGILNGQGYSDDEYAWASQWSMPAWLQVEFDDVYEIETVAVGWSAHNHTFSISLSMDGVSWQEVVQSRSSATNAYYTTLPYYEAHPYDDGSYVGSDPTYELFNIEDTLARYVRIDITDTSAPGSHIFQAMVGELEAYAVPEPATLLLFGLGGLGLLRRRKHA